MEPKFGELLTSTSVQLAVACYVLRISVDASGCGTPWAKRITLWLWTLGCAMGLAHVLLAFHYHHQWSHDLAYAHTARQTVATVGFEWGGGFYFNYLFLTIWVIDSVAWWRIGDAYTERRDVYWTVQIPFAIMIINATVVFGPPYWKYVALVIAFVLPCLRLVVSRR